RIDNNVSLPVRLPRASSTSLSPTPCANGPARRVRAPVGGAPNAGGLARESLPHLCPRPHFPGQRHRGRGMAWGEGTAAPASAGWPRCPVRNCRLDQEPCLPVVAASAAPVEFLQTATQQSRR